MAALITAHFLLLCALILTLVRLIAAQKCYQCMGADCNPDIASTVNCPSSLCFVLTVDVINSFRGCFKPGGYLVAECKANRFSSCAVCKGNLCNNKQPVHMATQLSCLRCKRGVCGPKQKPKGFRKCPLFRYPELARCYSIVDRFTDQYTFGCANEMTVEQSRLCERDWFQSVCQYCDTPNCNVGFFRGAHPRGLRCLTPQGQTIRCNAVNNQFPYFGCYIGNLANATHTYGCLSDLFQSADDPQYMSLFVENSLASSLIVCFEDLCNKEFAMNTTGNSK